MVENMFFPDNEHAGIGAMLPPPKKKVVCLFRLCVWFLKIILLGFFVAAIIMYATKVYK